MSKAAARKGDKCTGHPGAGPRANDQGSPDVFINNLPAHRQGDHWLKHSNHDSTLAQGSPTVFVNGKAQGRVGDRVACGSTVANGSPDVFVGDAASAPKGPSVVETVIDAVGDFFGGFVTWGKMRSTGGSGGGGGGGGNSGGAYEVVGNDGEVIASDDGSPTEPLEPADVSGKHLIWGKHRRVSPAFRAKVFAMAVRLGMPEQEGANWLMAVMAFETVYTFDPSKKNPGSTATGLIQFMAATARHLGTSTSALARMSGETQLDWVYRYLRPYTGRMHKLEDVYLAVFTPAAMGKPLNHVLYRRGQEAYSKNRTFDANRDGSITVSEISSRVQQAYTQGQLARNMWVDGQP